MKEKIRDNLTSMYGMVLLFASLCTVAFGGAYLGANMATNNHQATVDLTSDDPAEDEAE